MIQSYRQIIWDWNGTLLDDSWLCIELFNEALLAEGLPEITPVYFAEIFAHPVKMIYEQVGFDLSDGRFEEITREFHKGYDSRRHECQLREGAKEILHTLKEQGSRHAILSAHNQDLLKVAVQEYGVSDYFEDLAGLPDLNAASKVEAGRGLMASIGAPGDQVVLIGDTDHDAEVASALEIDCFLITTGYQSLARLEATRRPVVSSLANLIDS